MAPRYLAILFDIDGTLIVTGGDGVASWRMDLDTRYDPEGTHSAGVAGVGVAAAGFDAALLRAGGADYVIGSLTAALPL